VFVFVTTGTEAKEYYTVQAGSFKNLQTAETFLKQLKEKSCILKQKGHYHVIYCGKFEKKTDAEVLAENLKQQGLADVMVKKFSFNSPTLPLSNQPVFPKTSPIQKQLKKQRESSVIVLTPSSAHIWITVSMSDVNRFYCQKEDVSDVVFSAEKGVQVKIKGKNAFVKLVPIEVTDQLTGKVSYKYRKKPFEIYILCGDEVYSFIARPKKIPAKTFILEVPYQPDPKKSLSFFQKRTFEQSLLDLTLAAIKEEIPHGFTIKQINRPYSRYNEIEVILRRKLRGAGLELKEFLITAKKEVTLSESLFFSENPSSVCILDLKLNTGQTTRAFVITRKKDLFPSLNIEKQSHKKEVPKDRIKKSQPKSLNKRDSGFFFKTEPGCSSPGCRGGRR